MNPACSKMGHPYYFAARNRPGLALFIQTGDFARDFLKRDKSILKHIGHQFAQSKRLTDHPITVAEWTQFDSRNKHSRLIVAKSNEAMARSHWFQLSSGEAQNRANIVHEFRSRVHIERAFLAL